MARRPSKAGFGVPRDRHRWPSYDKVYQRRRPNRRRRSPGADAPAPAPAGDVDPVVPLLTEDGGSEQPLQVVEAEVEDVGRSDVMEEMIGGGRIRIRVSSWSKIERRGLRRRLAGELERVRCFMAGIEPEAEVDMLDEAPLRLREVVDVREDDGALMAMPADQEDAVGLGSTQPPENLAILPYNSNFDLDLEAAYTDARGANAAADEQLVDLTIGADDAVPRTTYLYQPLITIPAGEMTPADSEVGTPVLENEKRTPNADLFYPNSDYISGKKNIFSNGVNHLKPRSNGRGPRRPRDKMAAHAFKVGTGLVQKMIASKNGWIFDKPVDVVGLGLYDYFDIIKRPMDLGTVKSKLDNDQYDTPDEFAADVRLTFQNAMKYNAEHHEVHLMAKQLLNTFEGKWATVEFEYARRHREESGFGVAPPTYMMTTNMPQALPPEPRTSGGSRFALSVPVENEVPGPRTLDESRSAFAFPGENEVPGPRTLDESRSAFSFPAENEVPKVRALTPLQYKVPQLTLEPVENNVPVVALRPAKRSFAGKKPKAADLNKREMSGQEKRKLISDIEKLPPEKHDHVIQVLKRRKAEYELEDESYSIDIYKLDVETLWELDRLVSNYKKSFSKLRRRAELAKAKREAMTSSAVSLSDPNIVNGRAQKEIIEDCEGVSRSLPAEVENNGGVESGCTSSSSSSSDGSSSSSSDSDSGSSSSDSDRRHSPSTKTGD